MFRYAGISGYCRYNVEQDIIVIFLNEQLPRWSYFTFAKVQLLGLRKNLSCLIVEKISGRHDIC